MKMNLANKLTIFRIILVPIMVIIPFLGIENEIFGIPLIYLIIDIIFIIASITDKLIEKIKEYIKKQIFQESVGSKNYQLYMNRELYIFLYIIHY